MIDQGSLINQSHLVEQFSKPEPQLSQHQLQNIQTVQKTIKKYQNKVSQMQKEELSFRLKVIQKQKKHNDSLKLQLKTLNDTLNTMIQKINAKNLKKQDQHPKQDVIKKSLENQIKKSVALKKEVDSLRAKVKVFQGQKITDLHDQIRQKGKVIEQLTATIKMYQKIEKQEMNVDIYKKYQEANDKINSLNGELLHIKKKLNQTKKHEEIQQKSIKQQHQKMLSLQTKVKASSTSANFQKSQDKHEAATTQISKLKQNLQALQNAKKTNQKALRSEIQNLKLKNRVLEKQLEEAKGILNRKDKQANILVSKMKQISRRSHQTLQPVEKLQVKPNEIQNSSGLFDQRKQFKGLMFLQGTSRKFDDSQQLPLQKTYKVKSLKFGYFQQHIVELMSQYQLPDGSVKQVQSFKISHSYQNLKTAELILNQFEYIKDMQIYCSKFIQFMRIKTSRDQILQVGNQKNHLKCKKFTFDIKTNEKPIAIMGAIESKKLGNDNSKQLLISIGLQIKKKEVFTKSRFHTGLRGQSMKKQVSQSGFKGNDKNKLQKQ